MSNNTNGTPPTRSSDISTILDVATEDFQTNDTGEISLGFADNVLTSSNAPIIDIQSATFGELRNLPDNISSQVSITDLQPSIGAEFYLGFTDNIPSSNTSNMDYQPTASGELNRYSPGNSSSSMSITDLQPSIGEEFWIDHRPVIGLDLPIIDYQTTDTVENLQSFNDNLSSSIALNTVHQSTASGEFSSGFLDISTISQAASSIGVPSAAGYRSGSSSGSDSISHLPSFSSNPSASESYNFSFPLTSTAQVSDVLTVEGATSTFSESGGHDEGGSGQTASDERFQCQICPFTTNLVHSLTTHLGTHTGKTYKCKECQKSFTTSNTLKVHERIHTGEKPHTCSICKRKFTQSVHLTSHMTTHTGERPFRCDVCDKRFRSSSNLASHRRIHTMREVPFECPNCAMTFNKKNNLNNHMRFCFSVRRYRCDVCGKTFTSSHELDRHECPPSHSTL